jgi:hypothetical protein
MNSKKRTYTGPAEKFNDPVEGVKLKEHENKAREAIAWNADKEIEDLASYLIDYLQAPSGLELERER